MKNLKPVTSGQRGTSVLSFKKSLTEKKPFKKLTRGFRRGTGRNNAGRITVRHKGGGHKRRFREIDFSFSKIGIPAKIETIEYDPNRSGFISLVCYADGERRYILTPQGMKVGDSFTVGENADIKVGNRLPLKKIPVGTFVYNVEVKPKGGGKLVRSGGSFAEVQGIDAGYALIKMPSTEVRKLHENCFATIGSVSNPENKLVQYGKAGRSRWRGIRPTVRGTAMNPVDHPHGGGEGRQGRGRRRAVSMWGKSTGKGHKTRRAKKYSNFLIVSRRKVGKKKM
jgi:large subunit ribosomal protein L2